ncbi:MAG: ammonium transporter [Armatimonadetes bacterium]|nr:ammonium transporter [Armatimonadota bacterium]
MSLKKVLPSLLPFVLATAAHAQDAAPKVDSANSAWMIVATAMVLFMTPALALFYGGMVQKKNVLNTMLLSLAMMGVISLIWALVGYTFAFGKTTNGFIGGFDYILGRNISIDTPYGTQTIPAALFMLFQMKFAIITPALISGAIAERVRFKAYLTFMIIWSIVIYTPIACWVWNPDGWLCKMGALDFAGGTVVHLASGVSALALAAFIGPRTSVETKPNNITLVLLGAGMLWFGWFGFNAGSALAIDKVAVNAFLTTHLAAAAGMLAWMIMEMIRSPKGKATAIGGASGLVAGLVAITPAAGFVSLSSSILIGLAAGVVCNFAIELKHKMKIDDALDVVGVHGIGGTLGAILTGVFATATVNSAVEGSLQGGRGHLILVQCIAIVATIVFAGGGSYLLAVIVNKFTRLRSSEKSEIKGLDLAYHGELGYVIPTPKDPLVAPAASEVQTGIDSLEPAVLH